MGLEILLIYKVYVPGLFQDILGFTLKRPIIEAVLHSLEILTSSSRILPRSTQPVKNITLGLNSGGLFLWQHAILVSTNTHAIYH